MWLFKLKRIFEGAETTASVLYAPDGTHVTCVLEPGKKDRLPAGVYDLTCNAFGSSKLDAAIAQQFDPLGYRGMLTIGAVALLPPREAHGPAAIAIGWHVVRNGNEYEIPPDGFADGKMHGDGFCWAYRNIYAALAVDKVRVAIGDPE